MTNRNNETILIFTSSLATLQASVQLTGRCHLIYQVFVELTMLAEVGRSVKTLLAVSLLLCAVNFAGQVLWA